MNDPKLASLTTLRVPDVEAIAKLVAPVVAELLSREAPRRARVAEPPRRRDLASDLEAALGARRPATIPELARLLCARDADVREALARDSRFGARPAVAGTLAEGEAVGARVTTRPRSADELERADT
jgi:hypothetical protein